MAIQELNKQEVATVSGGGDGLLGLGILDGLLPTALGLVGTVLSLPLVQNVLGILGNVTGGMKR